MIRRRCWKHRTGGVKVVRERIPVWIGVVEANYRGQYGQPEGRHWKELGVQPCSTPAKSGSQCKFTAARFGSRKPKIAKIRAGDQQNRTLTAIPDVVTMTTLKVFMKKSAVGSRELKTRLGTYLRRVQQGETLVITERGRPIAELKPISVETSGDQRKIDELVALGMLTRQSGEPLERVKPVRLRGKPLSASILEDRKDRF